VFEQRLVATGQLKMLGGPAEFMRSIEEQQALVAAAAKSLGVAASQ
jgi:hypothetical protein